MKKKVLTVILTGLMIFHMLPANVWTVAAEDQPAETPVSEVPEETTLPDTGGEDDPADPLIEVEPQETETTESGPSESPEISPLPAETEVPEKEEIPEETAAPQATAVPEIREEIPAETEMPAEVTETEMPEETEEPAESELPEETPEATEKPAEEKEPATDISSHPLAETSASEEEPLLALDQLSPRTLALLGMAPTGMLMMKKPKLNAAPAGSDIPTEGPVTSDDGSMTIDRVAVKWLTHSTGSDEPAGTGTLSLETDSNVISNQQFQIDFALSGKDDHEPGTIEIIFPAYLWKDRYGNEPGNLTLSVPEEPETGADFAWRRVGDSIVITNVRRISHAAKFMIQGTFRNVKPYDMVDKDVAEGSEYIDAEYTGHSGPFNVVIGLTTNSDEYVALRSNTIDAEIDTHIEAASATKSAYNTSRREYYVYHTVESATALNKGNMPAEFLEQLGGEADQYSFVRWYVSGSATGSQPFLMTVSDRFDGSVIHYKDALHEDSETIEVNGRMLGVQGALVYDEESGTYSTGNVLSEDGQNVTAVIYDGYNTLAKSAYVWTAYKQSDFPESGDEYTISNSQRVEVTGWDDQITTTKEAAATAPFRIPITYTIVKVWNDSSNAKERRPRSQSFNVNYTDDNGLHYGSETLSGGGDRWQTSWSDEGKERKYSVSEYTNTDAFMRHIIEESKHYGNDEYGNYVEYDEWFYTLERQEYDAETHTWTATNKYNERHVKLYEIPFTVPARSESAYKRTNSYIYSSRLSKNDRALNILRRGEDVIVDYYVSGSASTLPYTWDPGKDAALITSYAQRPVTLELEDNYRDDVLGDAKNSLLFDSLRLTVDDAEIAYVTLAVPSFSQYGQWGANVIGDVPKEDYVYYGWSYKEISPADAPDTVLLGLLNGEWVEFARFRKDGGNYRLTTGNGATAASGSRTVNLPSGVERVKTVLTVPAVDASDEAAWKDRIDRASMSYSVGIRLLADSETLQKRMEAVFAQDDYGMCTLDNFVALNLKDESGDMFVSRTDWSRAYLHGRNHRVAVSSVKNFELVENDLIKHELKLHSSVTMTQQSNVLEQAEYYEAREEGLIPSTRSGTWYDLLPIGVMPDLDSVKLSDGDKLKDVYTIENYKGSGRIMVVVKAELQPRVSYTNTSDPNPYRNDPTYPREGYKDVHTFEFDSYYSWDQARLYGIGNTVRNVAAYEADEDKLGNINGWSGEPDDPQANHNQRAMDAVGNDKELMTGLDPERQDEHNAFVYAGSVLKSEEIDFMAATELRKYVTRDGLGSWTSGRDGQTQVTVHEGDFYTYMLYVASDNETTTKNIILLDSLEDYVPHGSDYDIGRQRWSGLFHSVDVTEVTAMGIQPVIYYNTSNLDLSALKGGDSESGQTVIDDPDKVYDYLQGNGWTTVLPEDPTSVKTIAVDLRHKADGSDFELGKEENLYVTVRMRARVYDTAGEETDPFDPDEEARKDPANNDYAFNSVYLGCTQVDPLGRDTHAVISYDYTRVGILPFELRVTKVWDDAANNDGKRPNGIIVHLLANGQRMDPDRTITLNSSNEWKGTFEHVIQYDEEGRWITYTFEEESADDNPNFNLEGYVMGTERRNEEVTLTNTYAPEKTKVDFTKTWKDDDGENLSYRPESITVRLKADGQFTGKTLIVKPDRSGNWTGSFSDLPKYTNPEGLSGRQREIEYTVEEEPVYKYNDSYEAEEDGTITITNRFYPYGHIEVRKKVENATEVSKDQEFTYTLLLKDPEGEDVTEKFGYFEYEADDSIFAFGMIGNGDSFTLKDGEKMVIAEIPSECTYEIIEEDAPGFTLVSSSGTVGTIRAGATQNVSFTNRYNAGGSESVSLFKTLSGRTMSRYQFRFELIDKNEGSETYDQVIRTASADANGNAQFSRLSYTEADHGKTFTYEIREVDREKPGYTYDTNTYTVKVTATDNGDGTLTCAAEYFKADGTKITDPADPENGVVFHNEYHAEGGIELMAWKQLPDGELSEYPPFSFELIGKDRNEESETYDQFITLQTKQSNGSGTVSFDRVSFTETDAGQSFLYIIKEVKGSDPRVIYDETLRGIELVVADNGDGTLAVTQNNVTVEKEENEGIVSYRKAAETTELPVFVNHLEPGDLSITKLTNWEDDGKEPDGNAQFPFVLTLNGEELPETITVSLSEGAEGQKVYSEGNQPVPLTEEEKAEREVELIDGAYRFSLKAGQILTVKNLPAGIAYQVSEETPSGWIPSSENAAGLVKPQAEAKAKYTNIFDPGKATATIVASKRMDGKAPAAGRFAFELVDDTEGSETKGEVLQTVANTAGGFIQFRTIYTEEGTYTYKLREAANIVTSVAEDGTITYTDNEDDLRTVAFDENEYTVTVVVTKTVVDGNETLTAEVSYENDAPAQFRNTTRPGSLQIRKAAEGLTEANEEVEFTFKVVLSNDAGMPLTDSGNMFWYAQDSEEKSPVEVAPETPEQPENSEPEVDEEPAVFSTPNRTLNAVRRGLFAAPAKAPMLGASQNSAGQFDIDVPEGSPTRSVTAGTNVTIDWYNESATIVIRPTDPDMIATIDGQTLKSSLSGFKTTAKYVTVSGMVRVTGSMEYCFYNWSVLNKADLKGLDTSGVTNLKCLFNLSRQLTAADLTTWNTSKVTNFARLFDDTKVVYEDLSSFTTESMLGGGSWEEGVFCLFSRCPTLEYLDVRNMTINSDTHLWAMLEYCTNLQVLIVGDGFRFNTSAHYSSATGNNGIFNGHNAGVKWYRLGIDNPQDAITTEVLRTKVGSEAAGTWVRVGYDPNFTIAFDPNGATGTMDPITANLSDTTILPPCTFESDLNFAGWSTDPNAILPEYADGAEFTGATTGGQTVTLYAIWMSEDSFLLHYDANGGYSRTQWQRVNGAADTVSTPVPIHPSNYEFLYWTTERDGSGDRYTGMVSGADFHAAPGATVNLYAQYLDPSRRAKVTTEHYLQKADCSGYEATPVNVDIETYDLNVEVTPEIRTYKGFLTPETQTVTVVAGGVTVKYYYDRTHYTLKFDANGGSGTMTDVTMTGGVSAKLPVSRFEKENSLFVGWNTEPDGSGTNYGDGQSINSIAGNDETVTLYAQWFSLDDGQSAEATNGEYTVKCKANETIVFPLLPAGTHYTITEVDLPEGWSLRGIENARGTVLSAERVNVTATNVYSAYTLADIVAHKALPGESFTAGQYSFQLLDEEGNVLQTVSNSNQDQMKETLDEEGNTIPNPYYGTAPVYFDSIRYEHQGIYHYTIKEVAGSDGSIRYDDHEEKVTVRVTDRGNGRLNAEVFYDQSGANFRNAMSSGDLKVSKTLHNATAGAAERSFYFTLYFFDSRGNEISEQYEVTLPDGTTTMISSGGAVSIKGGESFTVHGLPHKSSYIVVESPADGYELVSKTNDEGMITAGQTAEASFENAYNSTTQKEGGTGALIEAKKVLENGVIEEEQFSFRLSDSAGEEIETVYAGTDGKVEFSALHYTLEDDGKRFIYYVEEVAGNDPDITYDDHREKVGVTVHDNGDGTMTAEVSYDGETEEEQSTPPVFTNVKRPVELKITKTVSRYESSSPATFVFRVKGTMTDAEGEKNEIYNDVVSLTFSKEGVESVTLTGLPIGAEFTVEEIYSGAAYEIEGDREKMITLSGEEENVVSFTNTYDDSPKKGYGANNHFVNEEGKWNWSSDQTK